MKKIILFLSAFVVIYTVSCAKKESAAYRSPETAGLAAPISIAATTISADTVFKALIKGHLEFYKKIQNPEAIRLVLSDNTITPQEYRNYPLYFGCANAGEFENYYKLLNSRVKYLNAKYAFNSRSKQEQSAIVTQEIYLQLGIQQTVVNPSLNLTDVENCERQRRICLGSVSAQTILMHFGCAGLDLTIIAGIVCHSAATLYQYTEGLKCNDAYNQCIKTPVS